MRPLFRSLAVGAVSAAVLTAVAVSLPDSAAAAGQQRSAFNAGPSRAPEDPVRVAHGKLLFGASCQACHGSDLRGGDLGGPNLLRSEVTLTDQHGENIIPIIQGSRQSKGMPNIGLNDSDAGDVAAYVRSVVGQIGSQGRPPGEEKELDIVVGDATKGAAYFQSHCSSCHSEADMKGLVTKIPDKRKLQARWLAGAPTSALSVPHLPVKADVTPTGGAKVSGDVVHIDDFLITLRLADGSERTFARNGKLPAVVLHDPLQGHRDLLPKYTDREVHDVTAYLVTLK